jgi:hypothetical protein
VRLVLLRKFLEGETLGFRKKEGGENTGQHEESKDLENVFKELVGSTDVDQTSETDL